MYKKILLSLGITLLVSTLFALSLTAVLGFWHAFMLAFVGQLVICYFVNDYMLLAATNERERILNTRLAYIEQNVTTFQCPCGKNTFEEAIYVNDDNIFTCNKCNQVIKADLTVTPIIVTQPLLSTTLLDIPELIELE